MSTQKHSIPSARGWLIAFSEKALRMAIGGSAVAMMALAAHASTGDAAAAMTAPTVTSAWQMSIGFCALALALYRRQRKAEPAAAVVGD